LGDPDQKMKLESEVEDEGGDDDGGS